MLAADAHTDPLAWRRCEHPFGDAPVPRRCPSCGVVDHGPVRSYDPDTPPLGLAGRSLGQFIFGDPEEQAARTELCPAGHVFQVQHIVRGKGEYQRRICQECRMDTVARRLSEPCPNGHIGSRFVVGHTTTVRCHQCEAMWLRRRRAAEIVQRYAAHA